MEAPALIPAAAPGSPAVAAGAAAAWRRVRRGLQPRGRPGL